MEFDWVNINEIVNALLFKDKELIEFLGVW